MQSPSGGTQARGFLFTEDTRPAVPCRASVGTTWGRTVPRLAVQAAPEARDGEERVGAQPPRHAAAVQRQQRAGRAAQVAAQHCMAHKSCQGILKACAGLETCSALVAPPRLVGGSATSAVISGSRSGCRPDWMKDLFSDQGSCSRLGHCRTPLKTWLQGGRTYAKTGKPAQHSAALTGQPSAPAHCLHGVTQGRARPLPAASLLLPACKCRKGAEAGLMARPAQAVVSTLKCGWLGLRKAWLGTRARDGCAAALCTLVFPRAPAYVPRHSTSRAGPALQLVAAKTRAELHCSWSYC